LKCILKERRIYSNTELPPQPFLGDLMVEIAVKAGHVAQVVEYLPNKHEDLSPNPRDAKKKR
jgi:hypothetical protein